MEIIKITKEVVNIVSVNINVPIDKIKLSMGVGDVPEWGSMAHMSIITTVQARFDIEIPVDDLFDLMTVEDIINEIVKLKDFR